jgi:hypothetical protein
MLAISQLKRYENWVGHSPLEIRGAVVALGGWVKVFPRGEPFPLWASRVRNYFNERPNQLKLLGVKERSKAKRLIGLSPASLARKGLFATLGFSGDVYVDEVGRYWFEMSTAGTIYHYEGEVSDALWYKKWEAFVSRQKSIPVFKLISPDRTGGSLELCVHNWTSLGGKSQIGPEGKWVNIKTRVVINEVYKGSYNYSETGLMGFDEHNFRDVEPHSEEAGFYADPRPSTETLANRRFQRDDWRGRPIADSDDYISVLKH